MTRKVGKNMSFNILRHLKVLTHGLSGKGESKGYRAFDRKHRCLQVTPVIVLTGILYMVSSHQNANAIPKVVTPATTENRLQEVGENDFLISDMGPDGMKDLFVDFPSVLWNPVEHRYLVIWEGEDPIGTPTNMDYGIFGQILSSTGAEIGSNDFLIKDRNTVVGSFPSISMNLERGEYLTVWDQLETRIFGQRIDSGGRETGPNDFEIDSTYGGGTTDIVWNASREEYLVVWQVEGRVILGRRLSSNAEEIGEEIQISEFNPWAISETAHAPQAVWNDSTNEYLVVWYGFKYSEGPSEVEVFGQRLSATGDKVLGDFRITFRDEGFVSVNPVLAWNADLTEYVIIWNQISLSPGFSSEIRGQRLSVAGTRVGLPFKISHAIPNETREFNAFEKAVAWSSMAQEYLVAWMGDVRAERDYEIYGTRLNSEGTVLRNGNFPISDPKQSENNNLDDTYFPGVAWNSELNEFLIVWRGGKASSGGYEDEVYGQRLAYVPVTGPSETPTPTPWSDFDISPEGGDGRIDANDLLEFLVEMREVFHSGLVFQFADRWLDSVPTKATPRRRLLPSVASPTATRTENH